MGLLDGAKDAFDENKDDLAERAKDAVNSNEERIDSAVDRAGDFANEKTGGRFEGQIEQGEGFVQDKTGNL
ncbi:antitoxin [Propionibacteriaceae bacterium G57]|uniref:antitoxin n=1 Tax=Aestuariimicrobium sp. G57 TaxID=3418485 RepID=UPI003DA740E5